MSEVLTAKEAAEYLKLSVETVKAKARAGQMPATKIGREWRFSQRQLLKWIEDASWAPEELVDLGVLKAVLESMATEPAEDALSWDEAMAELDETAELVEA